MSKKQKRINEAISIALEFGGVDGSHHKQWVIYQMVRELAGKRYKRIIANACDEKDKPRTFSWDDGIAP